jgi:hypothetical protein
VVNGDGEDIGQRRVASHGEDREEKQEAAAKNRDMTSP